MLHKYCKGILCNLPKPTRAEICTRAPPDLDFSKSNGKTKEVNIKKLLVRDGGFEPPSVPTLVVSLKSPFISHIVLFSLYVLIIAHFLGFVKGFLKFFQKIFNSSVEDFETLSARRSSLSHCPLTSLLYHS